MRAVYPRLIPFCGAEEFVRLANGGAPAEAQQTAGSKNAKDDFIVEDSDEDDFIADDSDEYVFDDGAEDSDDEFKSEPEEDAPGDPVLALSHPDS